MIKVVLIFIQLTLFTACVNNQNKMTLKEKILNNTGNSRVLEFLEIDKSDSVFVIPKSDQPNYYYHEGLKDLWDLLGKNIPEKCKYTINGNGVLVNPLYGEIFVFLYGRYSFGIKYDFDKNNIKNSEELRVARNMDGIDEDIRFLGEEWVLGIHFWDVIVDVINQSYKKYGD